MNIENNRKQNKMKVLFSMGASIIFIMIGIALVTKVPVILSPLLVKGIGWGCILVFGFLLIIGTKKILTK